MKKMSFIITAGGTGGHILPGLSVYERLRSDKHDVRFICRKKDYLLIDDLKKIRTDLIFLNGIGWQRGISMRSMRNFIFLYFLFVNIVRTFFILLKYSPDAVIGLGGYITFPVLLISRWFKIPCFLCEQNSYPGMVNRIMSRSARRIFLTYDYSRRFLKNRTVIVTGNPLRHNISRAIDRKKAYQFFKFRSRKKVLLIMGGSQGAVKINETIRNILDSLKSFNIIWLVGKRSYQEYKKYQSDQIRIIGYFKAMNYAYSIADLAVCRAGAMSITELSYYGIPALFIPLAIAADNHQFINARVLVKTRAAELIEEKKLSPDLLLNRIRKLAGQKAVYKKNMKKFFIPNSETLIVKGIYKALGVIK